MLLWLNYRLLTTGLRSLTRRSLRSQPVRQNAPGPLDCEVSRPPALSLRSSNRGWRPSIYGTKRRVEPPGAPEPCSERDLGHRHRGLVDEPLGALHPHGRCHLRWRSTSVPDEQPTQMSSGHPEQVGEVFDRPAVVEKSARDEPQRPCDGHRSTVPCWCSRGCFGAASQTRAVPCSLGGGRCWEEDDIARLSRLHRIGRATIDPCG